MKLGLVGVGHLGKIHLKCIRQIAEIDLVGFYDADANTRRDVQKEFGVRAFDTYEELLAQVDAVDVVTTTPTHFKICEQAIKGGKHVFVEKPICATVGEAEALAALLAQNPGIKLQVGHVERFNPAFLALQQVELEPKFMEVHRLANFNPRSTDVSVIHDLMIHDIDIILHLVQSEVIDIKAKGVNIISAKSDICNARLEFANGCVANVTASRLSIKNMRKMRLFQEDAYISVDFLEKKTEIIRLLDEPTTHTSSVPINSAAGQKYLEIQNSEVKPVNAILEELKSFYHSVSADDREVVGLEDGLAALKVVERISSQMERNPNYDVI